MEKFFYKYPYAVENTNAGLEVKFADEICENERTLLKQAQIDTLAPVEAWTAIGTNNQLNYSTHGIFRYFGKFPPTIATYLIMQYTKENDFVMDPMAGSGTTVLEALLSNRCCRSYDISPLSILLQKVKTTHLNIDELLNNLENISANYRPLTLLQYPYEPQGLKNIDHWFLEKTQNSIRGLTFLINNIRDVDLRNFFNICLLSSVRPVSRATTQQGRLFLDVLSAKEDCLETFQKKAEKAIKAVNSLPEKKSFIEIAEKSVGEKYPKDVINDLIIVHPPYFNSYKYSSINSLELSWMKINHAEVRKKEVHEFFKIGKAENVGKYINDMNVALTNIVSTLKPGGRMALMIGDTIIKGEYIPVTRMLLDVFLSARRDVEIEKISIRVPKYTEASWTASQRRKKDKIGISLDDFIVIFRRKI